MDTKGIPKEGAKGIPKEGAKGMTILISRNTPNDNQKKERLTQLP